MTSEIYPDYDDEAVTEFYTCSRCGRDFEITDPTKEGKKDYKDYWQ